jgi:glycosyltransferase involved in cell wall biosynthesis
MKQNEPLYCFVDARDFEAIEFALGKICNADLIHVVPIQLSRLALRRYGNSRSRQSYIDWIPLARRAVKEISSRENLSLLHQVTFASASLPHALPKITGVRRIWGPLAVPCAFVHKNGGVPPWREKAGVAAARLMARINVRNMDTVIATNRFSQDWLSQESRQAILEPNIFCDPRFETSFKDPNLITMSGLLIDRKRPWLAIQAMAEPQMQDFRLQVVGDGPLRGELETLAKSLGVDTRVDFFGQVSKDEAVDILAASSALVHPSAREGAAWVIGEAASVGVPAVVLQGSGCESTVELSHNGGVVVPGTGNLPSNIAEGLSIVLSNPAAMVSHRWEESRLIGLLEQWWTT